MKKNKSIINGSFKDEFKSRKQYTEDLLASLKTKKKTAMTFWIVLTVLITLINIATIIVASLGLDVLLSNNEKSLAHIAPIISVVALVILSFVVTIITSIYQGVMKSRQYQLAAERIQDETFLYRQKQGEYKKENSDDLFKENVNKIIGKAYQTKGDFSIKKSLLKVLTGGMYE